MEKANKLRILVVRDGEEKAKLTFPLHTLKHIHNLMPESVLQKLAKRNIDIEAMVSQVEESGYRPQTLFELVEENKSYRVWIE
jgi:hypothetical protein